MQEAQPTTPLPPGGRDPQKRKSRVLFWSIFILVVILILGSGIGGFWLGQQTSNRTGLLSQTPTQENTPKPASPTPSPTAIVTPTFYTPGENIYTAKWSDWSASPQWKMNSSGTFGSDGLDDGSTTIKNTLAWAPTTPPLPLDYAVEADIQYNRSTSTQEQLKFGIVIRGNGKTDGYQAGMFQSGSDGYLTERTCLDFTKVPKAVISRISQEKFTLFQSRGCLGMTEELLSSKNQTFDTALHHYRVEVKGNTITLFIDKQKISTIIDNSYVQAGQVGLQSIYADITVSSFKVIAL